MLVVCLTAIRQLLRPERAWFTIKRKDPIVENKRIEKNLP